MTTPMPPGSGSNQPPPMLGLKPMEDAANKIERAAQAMQTSQSQLSSQLSDLNNTLGNLASSLGRGRGGRSGSTGRGHSYGQVGGGATFNGQPVGGGGQPGGPGQPGQPGAPGGAGGSGGGGQPPRVPNGGMGGFFSGWSWGRQPSPTAPGGIGRFAAAYAGMTPKAWNTQYNPLEMSAQLTRQGVDALAQRGESQLADQALMQRILIESRQRGATFDAVESQIMRGMFGTRSHTAGNFSDTWEIGVGAISSMQSNLDGYRAQDIAQRFSGGLGTKRSNERFKSLMESASGLGYTNPLASLEQTTRVSAQMIKPSQRLHLMMMGLPDPTDSQGRYKGNAQFFAAFLKRMFGKDSVPPGVFEDEFREGGLGWANLVNAVGEEAAELMIDHFRGYNYAKAMGNDVSDFDQTMDLANRTGKEGDKARKRAREKYNIGDENDRVKQEQRAAAKSRASELAGHEEFNKASYIVSDAMQMFADAVHKFVNSPVIADIAVWLKAIGPALGQASGAANMGAVGIFGGGGGRLNINGMRAPDIQGAGDGGSAWGGTSPVLSGGSSGPGSMEKIQKSEDLGKEIAKKAASYANSSRKYKYSMERRLDDGYFDCSSFVSRVYAQFGFTVGPTTVQMWRQGVSVPFDELQPGDILLHADGKPGAKSGAAEHTAMYIGDGKIVGTSARNKNDTIQIQPIYGLNNGYWDDARRIVGTQKPGKPQKDGSDHTADSDSGGLFDSLQEGVSNLLKGAADLFSGGGGGGGGGGTSGFMGFGSPNAAAYGTTELGALLGILSGGGGGGGGPAIDETAGSGSDDNDEDIPEEAQGTPQDPGGDTNEPSHEPDNSNIVLGKTRKDSQAERRKPNLIAESKREGFGDSPWTQNFAPRKHPDPNPQANKAIARRLIKKYGWEDQWKALERLWIKESNWNQFADNPMSDAYGIPQALPPWKMKSAGADWRTNPETQIKWGLQYIKERYGTPTKALAHHNRLNWYDTGAWQVPDDQVAIVHKDEMIIPKEQARTIRDALIKENLGGGVTGVNASAISRSGEPTIQLNFQPGSIVLNFDQGVSQEAGKGAARGFIKELENHELFKKIASGRRDSERDHSIA